MSCKIECEWIQSKRIVVNPDGQVWPCCYLANSTYKRAALGEPNSYRPRFKHEDYPTETNEGVVSTGPQILLKEYFADLEQHNIFHYTIEEIVESQWYTTTLPNSWTNPERLLNQCKVHCSKD